MYQLDANNFIMIFPHKWPLHVSDIYMSIFRNSYIQVVALPHVVLYPVKIRDFALADLCIHI